MYEEFTQNRIAQLRMQKNVSARDMSLTLGQNNSYINQIENKKALPSLQGLFYICEYFGITPQQFFDDGSAYPVQLADLVEDSPGISPPRPKWPQRFHRPDIPPARHSQRAGL